MKATAQVTSIPTKVAEVTTQLQPHQQRVVDVNNIARLSCVGHV